MNGHGRRARSSCRSPVARPPPSPGEKREIYFLTTVGMSGLRVTWRHRRRGELSAGKLPAPPGALGPGGAGRGLCTTPGGAVGNLAAAAALASHIAHGPETPSERGHGPRTQDTHVTKAQQERRGRRAASLLVPPSARAHLTVPVVTFPTPPAWAGNAATATHVSSPSWGAAPRGAGAGCPGFPRARAAGNS